jgi:hypothetical protein
MTFPIEGEMLGACFWINGEPVRITAWNYSTNGGSNYFFDIEFLDILREGKPAATMVQIPMGFDFYNAEVRRMSSLEMELL